MTVLLAVGSCLLTSGLAMAADAGAPAASASSAGQGADGLYKEYQSVVERNIFSSTARTPRPPSRPEISRPTVTPPPPPPGSGQILVGVIVQQGSPVALVEDTSSGETQTVAVGEETAVGRVEAITVDGVQFAGGAHIAVGYTLSGQPSQKLSAETISGASAPTDGGSSRSRGGGDSSTRGRPSFGRSFGNGGESSAPPVQLSDERRAEIMRRLQEARQRQLAGAGGAPGSPSNGNAAPTPPPAPNTEQSGDSEANGTDGSDDGGSDESASGGNGE